MIGEYMMIVNYRTSTIIGRLLICALFILTGVALILASIYLEAPALRKVISVSAGILGIGFFGRMGIMLIILLLKNKQMFRYDQENITVKDKTIKLDTIKKIEIENDIVTEYLGIKTPAFVLKMQGSESIYIPTYYVISKKDFHVVHKILKGIVSDRTKR
ncbi:MULTISPECIES: DUF5381 family protein [unclassified Mesobacillus]|jgi:hypothetical protein|uniref:DUF5381 family protein n=1 Tax=unclassified Mesobacillus TaxID=2675270 RepID=UPI00203ADBC2|nr:MULTISPECIES: DUF5381 family protein [unclassified Mesobacillus]MCM3123871.1 DUF5381 family protein [Mesobacillus sp. MER 33]MCM3234114.1 DUF5381 family protein [Mesobacillus sp. MER 48]